MTIAERLKVERERLGLSQTRWGELAMVVKQTVIQWEKGASAPDAVQLSALSASGADVLYILTGEIGSQALSRDEQELISAFRAAPLMVKAAAIGALTAGVPEPGKKTKQIVHGSVGQQAGGDMVNQKGVRIELGKTKSGGARKR